MGSIQSAQNCRGGVEDDDADDPEDVVPFMGRELGQRTLRFWADGVPFVHWQTQKTSVSGAAFLHEFLEMAPMTFSGVVWSLVIESPLPEQS